MRILGEGLDLARQAQLKANLGVGAAVEGSSDPNAGKTPGSGTAVDAAGPGTAPKQ
ncbi:hypothetical protein LJE72_24875 [Desulfosporosinus sp. SRJS8]|nr:hypothetical protein [Desulfosporosinus sp. SRJS8]